MSVIQKKPFIERVLDTFTMEQKQSLISLINGSDEEPSFRSLVNKTYNITEADKGVNHIILETQEKRYTGYLLYNSNYCVFVAYKNIQELNILQINPVNQRFEIVKEPLTILELRFELESDGQAGDSSIEVVELSNLSGTLTDEQYAKLSGNNCVIHLGTQTFYKEFDASTLITYQAFTRQAGQDQALFEYIEITKADKSWEYQAENIVEANPNDEPTDTLDKIKIGNTILSVGGGASAQDLTSNTAGTLDATAWDNLKLNHYHTITTPTMTGLDGAYDFVDIKLSINSVNQIVKLVKNTTNKYSGLFFIEESTNLYEIAVYYNGTNIILRCATVY